MVQKAGREGDGHYEAYGVGVAQPSLDHPNQQSIVIYDRTATVSERQVAGHDPPLAVQILEVDS
jgi:hypothetical protein